MIRTAVLLALMLAAATPAAVAQTPSVPDSENGRYTFSQSGEDLLRLDTRTGTVSLCNKREVGWSCLSIPDERAALETEIARLQRENVLLKRELIARGIGLPGDLKAPQAHPSKPEDSTLRLPSDADIERLSSFMEKVWRRFLDMVQTMQKEQEKKS